MVERFDSWVRELGPFGYLVLGLAAMLEYVFPPFPGDTITLLGGVYAVRGERPWPLVLLSVTVGSVLGAAINYRFGQFIADRLERRPDEKLFLGLSHARMHALQHKMVERGTFLLVINRFLPSLRALIFVAAGASAMPLGKVLSLGALSALAWNLLMLAIGIALGGNIERLEDLFWTYQKVALIAVGAVLAGLFLRSALSAHAAARARRRADSGKDS
jgi:membrane protein DedA with SNARE-associated domain